MRLDRELLSLNAEEREKWHLGQSLTTSGTRLKWSCLREWVEAWQRLQRRRHSSIRYQQEDDHIRALPIEMLAQESDPAVLYAFLEIMASGSGNRPRKGEREGDPTTAMVVAAGNRLAHLSAPPYREHRRQQALRRKLKATPDESEHSTRRHSQPSHLTLF